MPLSQPRTRVFPLTLQSWFRGFRSWADSTPVELLFPTPHPKVTRFGKSFVYEQSKLSPPRTPKTEARAKAMEWLLCRVGSSAVHRTVYGAGLPDPLGPGHLRTPQRPLAPYPPGLPTGLALSWSRQLGKHWTRQRKRHPTRHPMRHLKRSPTGHLAGCSDLPWGWRKVDQPYPDRPGNPLPPTRPATPGLVHLDL